MLLVSLLVAFLRLLTACGIAGATSPLTPPAPAPLPLLPGVKFITRVFEGGVGGCVMYRTPSLLNVGGGTLLAFTQCRQVSHGDASPQELHMKRSDDDGRTWGRATVLPFARDPAHNSLHRAQTVWDAKSQTVFLFDDALPYPTTKHNTTNGGCIVRVWKSLDLGKHWTSVENLTSAGDRGSGLATGIQLSSGKLLVGQRAGCNSHKSSAGAHALWSVDGGISWLAGSPTVPGVNENQIALLSNGSLLMNARTSSKDRLSLVSTDEGRSWGEPRVVRELSGNATCEGSLIAYSEHTPDVVGSKTAALYFSHPAAATRERLTIRRSRDDGDTWPRSSADELLVHEGSSAYSCLGSTSKGELAVLWEADGKDLTFATTDHFSDSRIGDHGRNY